MLERQLEPQLVGPEWLSGHGLAPRLEFEVAPELGLEEEEEAEGPRQAKPLNPQPPLYRGHIGSAWSARVGRAPVALL